MKTIKYQCTSRATPEWGVRNGYISVEEDNLYLAQLKLNKIMAEHKAKGDKIVWRNRHSMKVEVQDNE